MSDEYKDLSTGEQAQRDIGNAARLGKSTANAVKAASKAASGNIAGAAADIAKDEGLRRMVVFFVLLPALLLLLFVCCVMYAFPLAIYEATQGLGSSLESTMGDIKEAYLAGKYSDDGNPFTGFFKGIAEVGRLFFNKFFASAGALSEDIFSAEADLHVFDASSAPAATTWQKINAGKNKIDARKKNLENTIVATLQGPMESFFYGQFAARYDTEYDQFLGVTISVTGRDASDSDAVKLLALYSVMHEQDPRNMKVSDFLRWLGYMGGPNPATLKFEVCGIPCQMRGWSGTFMPRYLVDEARQNPEGNYDSYGCAAVDLMLQVRSPNLATIQATDTLSTIWIPVPRPLDENGNEIIEYDENGEPLPQKMEPKTIHCISYTVPITVTVRNTTTLMKTAGLLQGSTAAARFAALKAQIQEDVQTEATPAPSTAPAS